MTEFPLMRRLKSFAFQKSWCAIKGILSRVQNLSRFNKRYVRPPSMLCPWSYYIYNKQNKIWKKKTKQKFPLESTERTFIIRVYSYFLIHYIMVSVIVVLLGRWFLLYYYHYYYYYFFLLFFSIFSSFYSWTIVQKYSSCIFHWIRYRFYISISLSLSISVYLSLSFSFSHSLSIWYTTYVDFYLFFLNVRVYSFESRIFKIQFIFNKNNLNQIRRHFIR